MSLPQPHIHPAPLRTLAPHLLTHLPNSLPLLRRLQFHHSSPTARTFATFPPTAIRAPPSFSATYVDRNRYPETECWIFSTLETAKDQDDDDFPDDGFSPERVHSQDEQSTREAKAQLLALLREISHLQSKTPLMVLGTLSERLLPLLGGDGLEPQQVISRDIGESSSNTTTSRNAAGGSGILTSISVPYKKWLIPPPSTLSSKIATSSPFPLPPAYTFSTVLPSELPTVISRTAIPRSISTLSQLGNVCIRHTGSSPASSPAGVSSSPRATERSLGENADSDGDGNENGEGKEGLFIAWAFLGPDGSLTSLHVEPRHRGLGLAKALCQRLFGQLAVDPRGMGFSPVHGNHHLHRDKSHDNDDDDDIIGNENCGGRGEKGEMATAYPSIGWAHSDVAVDNVESAGVVRGLGGREGWVVRWVGVDLRRVEGHGRGGQGKKERRSGRMKEEGQ